MAGDDFGAIYSRLRAIMLTAAVGQTVAFDESGNLVVRSPLVDPKTNQRGWFGTVTIKKSYVAYHLMPLYDRPALADGISSSLAKRRQGKTCFNFKCIDEKLFDELSVLTMRANNC